MISMEVGEEDVGDVLKPRKLLYARGHSTTAVDQEFDVPMLDQKTGVAKYAAPRAATSQDSNCQGGIDRI